jgi:hypothetical protein
MTDVSARLSLLLVLTLGACSFSYSSKSISSSVESSSDSVSSSSPGGAERAYRHDVRDYAQAYASSGGGDYRAFQADLAKVAERHGITDWESSMTTWVAVGEGLGRAKVNDAQLMAYKRNLAADEPRRMEAIQQGYDSAR